MKDLLLAPLGDRITQRIEAGLGTLARVSFLSPLRTLGLAALVMVAALTGVSRLEVDTRLTALLPESFRSVRDLDRLEKRFGGVGFVAIAAEGAEPEALKRFADNIAAKLKTVEGVRWVRHRRDAGFFEERGLYYLGIDDLETISDRLAAREKWEHKHNNPLYIDFEESTPPPLDFADLRDKYARDTGKRWVSFQGGGDYYFDSKEGRIAVLVKPTKISSDLTFARGLVARIRAAVASIDTTAYGPKMQITLTGRYAKRVEQQAMIEADLRLASITALLLVLAFIAMHFRRALAVVLITAPLVAGLIPTFGLAGLLFGQLNILSAFIGAILLGLGIDHGIHLLFRFRAERKAGADSLDAVRSAFGETGRAVAVAAMTTFVAFGSLALSEFRAFREFGVIAASGIFFIVLAYATILPALLGIAGRLGWRPGRRGPLRPSAYAAQLQRWAPGLLAATGLAVLGALVCIPSASFNYDFASLQGGTLPAYRMDDKVRDLLGYSQIPVVVLTDTQDEERHVVKTLRERKRHRKERSRVDFIAASTDLVPERQGEKRLILEKIGNILERVKPTWLDPKSRKQQRQLRRMAKAAPFTESDLPQSVRRQFRGLDGSDGSGFVLVFPSISLDDGREISELAAEVRNVELPKGKIVSAAGEGMILADVLHMIWQEAPWVMSLTLVFVFLTVWLLLGRLSHSLLCLLPAALTLILTAGLLPLTGLKLNYMNIIMVPVLFGVGVDGGAHIIIRTTRGEPLESVLAEAGRAIAGAILTSCFGFGALCLAHQPGLSSVGQLALIGLAVNLLACLVSLPALLAWLQRRRDNVLARAGPKEASG